MSDDHQKNRQSKRYDPQHQSVGSNEAFEDVQIPLHVRIETCGDFDASQEKEDADATNATEQDAAWEETDKVAES